MTTDELNTIVQAVIAELEKSGVDFDYKAEQAEDDDLVFVIRGTAPNYQGVTVTWKGLLDIITAQATQAKNDAETAKNAADTILSQVTTMKNNVTTMESNVSTMKTSVETSKSQVETMKTSIETTKGEVETLKSESETAKETATQKAAETTQAKGDVESMKASIEKTVADFNTLADQKKSEVESVYQTDLNELKGDLSYLLDYGIKYKGDTSGSWSIANDSKVYLFASLSKGEKIISISLSGTSDTIPKLYITDSNYILKQIIQLNTNNGSLVTTRLDYVAEENVYIFIGGCESSFKYTTKTSQITSGSVKLICAVSDCNIGDTLSLEYYQNNICFNVDMVTFDLSYNVLNIVDKKPYSELPIFFEVSSDQSFNVTSADNSVVDNPSITTTWGVLKLPEGYLPRGEKTKLCVFMHGSSGGFTNQTEYTDLEIYHGDNLVQNGYAVMDVSVNNWHMASPIAMSMYRKAIQYVIDNYNVESQIYLHGHSMGGWTALNFVNKFSNLVKVLGLWYPCIDAYNQAWCNTAWTKPKQYMPEFYNFTQTADYEADKVIGFNPIKTNTLEINGVKYTSLPCPIKIWHGQNDTMMPIQYSRDYVEALHNNGCEAYLREVENLGHEWSDILKAELLNWFNRF